MLALVLHVLCNAAIDDSHEVSQALEGFHKSKWKVFGRQLGLKSALLDQINADYQQNGVGECFNQVLEAWLNMDYDKDKFGPPTWHSLADAVKKCGNPALAAKIMAKR